MASVPDPPVAGARGAQPLIDLRSIGTFLRQWARDPIRTASVAPSGRQLARLMVAQLPDGCTRVAEIGAGTGAFTRVLLERGVAAKQLLVVEINPRLAEFLRGRFPDVVVECADARSLDVLARQRGLLADGKLDAVVSGLGLLLMNSAMRADILRAAFAALRPGGRFIQFTYGPLDPVRRAERDALGLRAHRAGFAPLNVPPAAVHVYERAG